LAWSRGGSSNSPRKAAGWPAPGESCPSAQRPTPGRGVRPNPPLPEPETARHRPSATQGTIGPWGGVSGSVPRARASTVLYCTPTTDRFPRRSSQSGFGQRRVRPRLRLGTPRWRTTSAVKRSGPAKRGRGPNVSTSAGRELAADRQQARGGRWTVRRAFEALSESGVPKPTCRPLTRWRRAKTVPQVLYERWRKQSDFRPRPKWARSFNLWSNKPDREAVWCPAGRTKS